MIERDQNTSDGHRSLAYMILNQNEAKDITKFYFSDGQISFWIGW